MTIDMSQFIIAKSDQLNADDLIGGPRTITITGVRGNDSADQPVSVSFAGDDGKPFKPCKSMRRVMVAVWGKYADKYVGQSMTLYRDPEVQFGGMKVGGIRISHMTGLAEKKTMALTATRGKKGVYTVHPLTNAPAAAPKDDAAAKWANAYIARLSTFTGRAALEAFEAEKATKLAELQTARPNLHAQVTAALAVRKAELAPSDGAGFDDDLTAGEPNEADERLADQSPEVNDSKSDADRAVDEIKEKLEAAPDAEAVEEVIKEASKHMTFLSDPLQIALEIAFDNARNRVKVPEVAE